MTKRTGLYPRLYVAAAVLAAVGQAGGVVLIETIRAGRLDRGLSTALVPWRKPMATHDPGNIMLDLERYGVQQSTYLSVKPGITGLWQVSGRSETGYDERVRLDVEYVRTWKLTLDLYISSGPCVLLLRSAATDEFRSI